MSTFAPPVTIRPARPEDADVIGALYVETWRSAYAGILPDSLLIGMSETGQTAIWRRTLATSGESEGVRIAALPNGAVAGFGSCGFARAADRFTLAKPGEVYTLYVAPDYQNLGVGRALLVSLFRRMRDRGAQSAVVWVVAANPSRHFYHALGGRPLATRRENLWGAEVEQIAYGWSDLGALLARHQTRDKA